MESSIFEKSFRTNITLNVVGMFLPKEMNQKQFIFVNLVESFSLTEATVGSKLRNSQNHTV